MAPGASGQATDNDVEPDAVSRAPVTVDGHTLFYVRGLAVFPAEKRAEAISQRIRALAANPKYNPGSLQLAEQPSLTRVEALGKVILNVTDADAAMTGVARSYLATLVVSRVDEAIVSYREARTPQALWRSAIWGIGISLLFAAGLFLFLWLYRRLEAAMERYCRRNAERESLKAAGVLQADQLVAAVLNMLRVLRTLAIVIGSLGYLSLLLAQFPWTRGFSARSFELLLGPLRTMGGGILKALPDLAFVAVLALLLRWVLRLVRVFFDSLGKGTITLHNFEPEWAEPTFRIVRFLVIAFGVVVAYPYLPGSGSEAFKGVSLFIGVIFSLGSTGFMSNMVAGYSLTYRRAYRVGDRVKIGDIVGDVEHVRLQVTHLRSLKNEEIIIPNSVVVNNSVVNYSSLARKRGLILHTTVGIGYETPWRQVEAMLLMAAARTEGLLREPPPFVMHKLLGDFCVTYELNVYCDDPSRQMPLYTALHRNILDVFNEYGVQIMTPAYECDPSEPKIVPKEKWFESPATGSA